MLQNDPILRIENVTKRFGGLTAVSNVTINVNKNEILGLIGPNGAGKTTLFSLISGFLKPNSGQIIFENNKIAGLRPHKICKLGLTRTFQLMQPFTELSVLDNVVIGSLAITDSVHEACEKAYGILELLNLEDKAMLLSTNLTLADQKKLEIAKALATNPKMILLDEVMSGLTPKECNDAVEFVKKIRDTGVTIIVIEHVMQALMSISDRVVVMHYGEVISQGLPVEVVNDPDVIEAYFGS